MFLTIAPKMISKKTAHQPRISYLVLDEAEDFWDALTKVSFARGRVLGSGSFPLQLLRLLKPTVSDPPELERKAAVASCCHKYSVEVFFCYICETFVYISIIFCTCHPKDSTKKLVWAPQKPRQAATSQPLWCRDARAQWGKLLSGWSLGCKTLR